MDASELKMLVAVRFCLCPLLAQSGKPSGLCPVRARSGHQNHDDMGGSATLSITMLLRIKESSKYNNSSGLKFLSELQVKPNDF